MYYLTTFTIQTVSRDPVEDLDLESLAYEITEGDLIGGELKAKSLQITSKEAADSLTAFGADPGFFNLDDDGNEVKQ